MLDKTTPVKRANAIDIHVGARIRMQRNVRGMSQEALGEKLGVTFQQIQKYEKGTNRVGASRLQATADALGVPPAFFFENAPGSGTQPETASPVSEVQEFLATSDGLALVRAYTAIKDADARRKILGLTKAVAHLSAAT